MRSFLLACLFGTLPFLSPAQTPTTANVQQAQGKYVFCYAQPVAPYDVVFSFTTTLQPSQRMTLSTIVGQMLTAAQLEAGAQLKPFDAILMQAGQRDLAIKFRDTVPQDQRSLATVHRVQGKPVFIFSEPVSEFSVVKTEGISWYNHAFGGAYYTFGKVEENLLRTAKKTESVDAILFGETATYISFK